jgi:ATP-binding cassette subfamily F protein uup
MEMDHGAIYTYRGNYQNFLEKREERIANYNAETDKVRNILRRELEWIRSTPCARTGKARYRINAFYDLKDRASQVYTQKQVNMDPMKGSTRLGTKIINCKDLSFYYGDSCYLDKFTYNFQRYEKVGIVGRNGAGKSTFLNLLTGRMFEDDPGVMTGVIERGESLKIGYYHQSGMAFNPDDTVLDIVNDTWLLNRFLFPHEMLNNKVEKLSGGEKRRLYLLTILMQQPNLLILDEPTNDLDIVTLNILEEYLQEFGGSLIIVSHDRHFLDKLVDHLFIFCGDGLVKDFVGSYSEYREFIKEYEAEQRSQQSKSEEKTVKEKTAKKRKLSFKEQKELEQLEKDVEDLAAEKASLEEKLNSGTLPYEELQAASERIGEIMELTDEKEFRLLELYEMQ